MAIDRAVWERAMRRVRRMDWLAEGLDETEIAAREADLSRGVPEEVLKEWEQVTGRTWNRDTNALG